MDEAQVRSHVDQVVRATVEETLNSLLDAEADQLCGAKRYERSPERLDTRSGHYARKLLTKAGEVQLQVPRLRSLPFETQIIERYRRRESSVEEALVEMYLAGVSVRRVEDITEALWGKSISPSTVSELNQKIYAQIEAWRNRADRWHPCLRLFGWHLAQTLVGRRGQERGGAGGRGGECRRLPRNPRRLRGGEGRHRELARLPAAVERAWVVERAAVRQRQVLGFGRIPGRVLSRGGLAAMHGALVSQRVHGRAQGEGKGSGCNAQGDSRPGGSRGAREKSQAIVAKLESRRLGQAAEIVRSGCEETLSYMSFPREHWTRLRTNNMLERIMCEIRRRTRVVGNFPDGQSARCSWGLACATWPEPNGAPAATWTYALNRPRARTAAVRGLGLIATTDFPRGGRETSKDQDNEDRNRQPRALPR